MKAKYHIITFIFSCALLLAYTPKVEAETLEKHISSNTSMVKRDYTAKSLEALIKELLTYNPELRGLVANINAAQAYTPQASALDDPRLSFEASNIPINNPSLNRTPMTGLQIYLRQKIPFPGKRHLKKRIAQSMEEQTSEVHLEKLNQLVAKFKIAYYDYAFASKAIYITQKTHSRLESLTTSLESRYAAGQVPQQDVLKTKVESSKIRSRLIQLRKLKKTLLSRINTLLVRPPNTPLRVSTKHYRLTKLAMSLEELRQLAQDHRPWLNKAEKEIQEAKYQHSLAKKDLLPDFDFSAGYRFRNNGLNEPIQGTDFFSTGVSINIPIWSFKKQGKKITQTRHKVYSAKHQKEAVEQEIYNQVETLYYQVSQFKEQYFLFRSTVVPETKAALSSSQKSYEAGDVDYLNVITNEMSLFNNQLMMTQYLFDHEKKIAELEMAAGKRMSK